MEPSGLDTVGGLIFTLNQRGVFAVTADPNLKSAVKSEDLADIAAQDIKGAPYTLTLDKSRLMTDEIGWSKAWMNANLIGLGGGHSVSVTWNPVVNVDGYNVYRSAVSGGPYTKIASVTTAAYTDYAVNPQQVWAATRILRLRPLPRPPVTQVLVEADRCNPHRTLRRYWQAA